MRIVSLRPACTEWLAGFGAIDQLVGRSHECSFPDAVQHVPAVTESVRPDGATTSRRSDAGARGCPSSGLPQFKLKRDAIPDLAPDIIITQMDGCGVGDSQEDFEEALSGWAGTPPSIFMFRRTSFKGVLTDALALGKAIGRAREAMEFIAEGEQRLRMLQRQLGIEKRTPAVHRPTVACIGSVDPVTISGCWIPDLVELAGGRAVAPESGERAVAPESGERAVAPESGERAVAPESGEQDHWSTIQQADPNVVAIMPNGFGIDEIRSQIDTLSDRPGWTGLNAVRNGRVFAFDGSTYMNQPSPRLYRSIELLGAALHPGKHVTEIHPWEMQKIRT